MSISFKDSLEVPRYREDGTKIGCKERKKMREQKLFELNKRTSILINTVTNPSNATDEELNNAIELLNKANIRCMDNHLHSLTAERKARIK